MLFNLVIHIAVGVFGANIFLWSGSGILWVAVIALVTQSIDIVRMYFYHKNRILAAPESVREEQMQNFNNGALYKFSQLYVFKVVWYGAVVLISAQTARYFGV